MSKVKLRHFLTIAIGIIVAWVFISRVIVPWFYKPRDTAKLKIQNLQSKVLKLRQLEAVSKNDIPLDHGYWGFCTNGVESMGNRNINTIGFGPGDEQLAHTTDEYLEIYQLEKACKVYKDLISIFDNQ